MLPETVPVRTLSDASSAVMKLSIGESGEDAGRVRVLDVQRGSAA